MLPRENGVGADVPRVCTEVQGGGRSRIFQRVCEFAKRTVEGGNVSRGAAEGAKTDVRGLQVCLGAREQPGVARAKKKPHTE